MFKALLLGFIVGVVTSQQVQTWTSDGVAGVKSELRATLSIEAYDKLTAVLR
jgi:hypothetical protein